MQNSCSCDGGEGVLSPRPAMDYQANWSQNFNTFSEEGKRRSFAMIINGYDDQMIASDWSDWSVDHSVATIKVKSFFTFRYWPQAKGWRRGNKPNQLTSWHGGTIEDHSNSDYDWDCDCNLDCNWESIHPKLARSRFAKYVELQLWLWPRSECLAGPG